MRESGDSHFGRADALRARPPDTAAAGVRAEQLADAATPLALITALIWIVHPLQTNAVTYIVQRTEVLAGLFYLLTLYCVLRGRKRPGRGDGIWRPWFVAFWLWAARNRRFPRLWWSCSTTACFWPARGARLSCRGWLYAGLASAWLVPAFYPHALAAAPPPPTAYVRYLPGKGGAEWLDYALADLSRSPSICGWRFGPIL